MGTLSALNTKIKKNENLAMALPLQAIHLPISIAQ
jgi:hypothetical protein